MDITLSDSGISTVEDSMITIERTDYATFERKAAELDLVLPIEQTGIWARHQSSMPGRMPFGAFLIKRDRDVIAVLSLIDLKTHGYHYLRSMHGPAWVTKPTRDEERAVIEAIIHTIRSMDRRQVFLRLDTWFEEGTQPVLSTIPYDSTVIIDVTGGDEAILSRMKRRGRRDVRKALRESPVQTADETSQALENFSEYYEVMTQTGTRDGFTPAHQDEYASLIKTLGHEHCRVFAARRDGQVVAWSIVTINGSCAVRYYAAMRNDVMRLHVTDKLLYQECSMLGAQGIATYDLMGIGSDFSPKLNGLNEFKTKFAEEITPVAPGRDIPIKPWFYSTLKIAKSLRNHRRDTTCSKQRAVDKPKHEHNVLPVILGSGANAYGLARDFYQQFGVKSLAVAPQILVQCSYSKFLDSQVLPDVASEQGFVPALRRLAEELKAKDSQRKLLIIACGDTTAALLAHHREEIGRYYLTATTDADTLDRAVDKVAFWHLCQEAGVGTPLTATYSYEDYVAGKLVPEPAAFPLEFKAADSVSYLDVHFPGRKKAYTVANRHELNDIAREIYAHAYRGQMIVQEFIAGDDTEMRTINAYVNTDGRIAMMCLGTPVLVEYAPARIGNYAAIISHGDEELYQQCATLLATLGYTGLVNVDIKRDPRDGSYRFLEINPRPGGSSDFTSCAGYPLARYIWRDLVEHEHGQTQYCSTRHLWLGVPVFVLKRFAPNHQALQDVLALIDSGHWSRSAVCKGDLNVRRLIGLARWQLSVTRQFLTYAPSRPGTN